MATDDSLTLPLYCPLIVNGEEGKAASGRTFSRENPADVRKIATVAELGTQEDARAAIDAARGPYVIVVVPLLFETGACVELVRRVLVVDCDEAEQVRRVVAARGLAAEEVRRIMATQLPRAERLRRADDVLHNDGGIEALRGQVGELHVRYLELARRA